MKVWNYVYIALTMMLILQFSGFQTGFSGIFSFINVEFNADNTIHSVGLSFSNFVNYIFAESGWLDVLIGAGIALGLYASGKPDIAIKAGFASAIFASFVPTLYFAITYALELGLSGWAVAILGVIFIPFSIMFLFALIEYVVGGNTD